MARNSYFRLARWFGAGVAIFLIILVANPPVWHKSETFESAEEQPISPPGDISAPVAPIPPAETQIEPRARQPEQPTELAVLRLSRISGRIFYLIGWDHLDNYPWLAS
jgi:hypothetical protein